jgi:F-type H+-transporting ATPase subunit delta
VSESARQIVREVYSEVLFELAEQAECIDSVMEDMVRVANVLNGEPEFATILTSPGIKGDEKAQIIRRVFEGKVEALTLDFISVLARRDRIGFLGSISDNYEIIMDVRRQRSLVEVVVAHELDDEQIGELKADLAEAINKEVKLSVMVEPEIIGGIIIKKDDLVIDNSVKTTLQRGMAAIMENLRDRTHEV